MLVQWLRMEPNVCNKTNLHIIEISLKKEAALIVWMEHSCMVKGCMKVEVLTAVDYLFLSINQLGHIIWE